MRSFNICLNIYFNHQLKYFSLWLGEALIERLQKRSFMNWQIGFGLAKALYCLLHIINMSLYNITVDENLL